MALSFKCKQCGHKYHNVSSELLGRKIRCECGQTQRLLSREQKERRDKKKKRRKKPADLEPVKYPGDSGHDEEVYDVASQAIVLSSQLDDGNKKTDDPGSRPAASHIETELRHEADWPSDAKETASTLPTLRPGYFKKKSYKPSAAYVPDTKSLNIIGIASGAGSTVLGLTACVVSTRMLLAGNSGSSFMDPITRLKITLCSDAGIRVAAFFIFVAAAALVIGGVSQLASAFIKEKDIVPKPLWPDRLVAFGGLFFILVVCLDLFIVNQIKHTKLRLRQANLVQTMKSAEARGNPLGVDFATAQQDEFDETKAAANRGVHTLFFKSIPLCLVAGIIAVLSLIRDRNTRRILSLT